MLSETLSLSESTALVSKRLRLRGYGWEEAVVIEKRRSGS